MEYSESDNRRKFPRARKDLSVRITILDSPENTSLSDQDIECHTKDISFQGMCIFSKFEIFPGSKLDLDIHIGSPPSLYSFKGVVIWCKYNNILPGYEVGIQFQDMEINPATWRMSVINLLAG